MNELEQLYDRDSSVTGVGTGYFDTVTQTIQGAQSSSVALKGSTEEEQFQKGSAKVASAA